MLLLKAPAANTVANYLKIRLIQMGVQDLFGVAGNYAAPFLDTVLADPLQRIKLLGTSTEMNAGYAADAYARYRETPIKFVTSFMSKSVLDERHPLFDSCRVIGKNMSEDDVEDYCLLGIGGWTVDANVASQNIRDERLMLACNDGVLVGAEFFPMVALPDFIQELKTALAETEELSLAGKSLEPLPAPNLGKNLTFDAFFHHLENNWNPDNILLSGVGFTLSIASCLRGVAQNGYLTDGVWLSIGYPVGAATGVAQACKRSEEEGRKRTFVVVGDGAFQEVCQAVFDQNFHGQNNVVFVLSNTIYGIEQFLVNPNPFREPPVDYPKKDDLLNSVYSYNDLHQWDYVKLGASFGSIGRRVETLSQLADVLCEIEDTPTRNFLVEVVVPKTDIPADLLAAAKYVGEDETANENWPPATKF